MWKSFHHNKLPVGVVGRLNVLGRNDVEGQDSVGSAVVHFGFVPDATWWDREQHDTSASRHDDVL